MMRLTSLLAAVALAAAHTRDTYDPEEFVYRGRAPATAEMTFSAALPQRNIEKLEAIVMDISDPRRYARASYACTRLHARACLQR